jgi:sulfane dehydrogenase subunit SoxC
MTMECAVLEIERRTIRLQEPILTRALYRFRLWDGQPAVIQTLAELPAVRCENYFCHDNAVQPLRIDASGEVTNTNA